MQLTTSARKHRYSFARIVHSIGTLSRTGWDAHMNQWIAETAGNIAGNMAVDIAGWEGHLSSGPRQLQAGPLSAELAEIGRASCRERV